jgi:hypothetical protein
MWLRFSRIGEEADALLMALGRVLAVAQNFENNARFVLRIAQMGKDYTEGRADKLDELIELADARPRQMFGGMVRGFDQLGDVLAEEIEVLRRGAATRNYIAHEAAVGFAYDRPQDRTECVAKLAEAVRNLVRPDNVISCWSYEIQEKPRAPITIRTSYPSEAYKWVMKPLAQECDMEEEPERV